MNYLIGFILISIPLGLLSLAAAEQYGKANGILTFPALWFGLLLLYGAFY